MRAAYAVQNASILMIDVSLKVAQQAHLSTVITQYQYLSLL